MGSFFRVHKKYLWLAFLIPTVLGTVGYIIAGIAPFGDNCLLAIDAWGQYFPMLKEMRRVLREGFSQGPISGVKAFFGGWSWSGALGFNRYVEGAYYTNSPLWIILYFLPDSMLIVGVDLLVLFRFGLAGATCYRYLERRGEAGMQLTAKSGGQGLGGSEGRDSGKGLCTNLGRLCFSAAYACCAYPLAFIHQFMWLDAYALFPLVILGLEKLADGGAEGCGKDSAKPKLFCFEYIIPLTITMISCFYTAYMVCVFCAVYFVMLRLVPWLFSERKPIREIGKSCLVFAANSLTAGGLSVWVWLPSIWALRQTASAGEGFEGALRFYHGFGEMAARFLPFSGVHLVYEAPNLYCGLVCALLCCAGIVLYAVDKSRKKGKKNAQETGRKQEGTRIAAYAVLIVFLLVSLNLNLLDFVWHGFHYPRQLPGRWSFILAFVVVSCAWRVWEKILKKGWSRLCIAAAFLLICEVSANELGFFLTQVRTVSASGFTAPDRVMDAALGEIRKREGDNFYRVELNEPYNFNSGQLYGYPGISYYSSTMTEAAYRFFKELQMPVYALNVSTRYKPETYLNRLFGVKYLLEPGRADEGEKENVFEAMVTENADVCSAGLALQGSLEELNRRWERKEGGTHQELWDFIGENSLDKGSWEFDGETCVRGKINIGGENAGTEGSGTGVVLLTTIPDDGGWSVWVDGKKREVGRAFDYLCAVELEPGEHTVEFRYEVPLLKEGLAAALVFVLAVILYLCYTFLKMSGAKVRHFSEYAHQHRRKVWISQADRLH